MRLTLNQKAEKLVQKLQNENAKRKISKENWAEIFSEALLNQPQVFWKEQIEKHTPEQFLVENALKDPKLTKEISEFLRAKYQSEISKERTENP
jgi:tRNA A22 N-methylase